MEKHRSRKKVPEENYSKLLSTSKICTIQRSPTRNEKRIFPSFTSTVFMCFHPRSVMRKNNLLAANDAENIRFLLHKVGENSLRWCTREENRLWGNMRQTIAVVLLANLRKTKMPEWDWSEVNGAENLLRGHFAGKGQKKNLTSWKNPTMLNIYAKRERIFWNLGEFKDAEN